MKKERLVAELAKEKANVSQIYITADADERRFFVALPKFKKGLKEYIDSDGTLVAGTISGFELTEEDLGFMLLAMEDRVTVLKYEIASRKQLPERIVYGALLEKYKEQPTYASSSQNFNL